MKSVCQLSTLTCSILVITVAKLTIFLTYVRTYATLYIG